MAQNWPEASLSYIKRRWDENVERERGYLLFYLGFPLQMFKFWLFSYDRQTYRWDGHISSLGYLCLHSLKVGSQKDVETRKTMV